MRVIISKVHVGGYGERVIKVVIKWRSLLLGKVGDSYSKRNEIVRVENEVVISEIVVEMVHDKPYEGFQKIPHILVFITCH
jgi:hypothetical protein